MKELLRKSLKYNVICVTALSGVCLLLGIILIYQNHYYNETLNKQMTFYQETLEEQMEDYMDLLKAEEPVKNNKLPKKNLGKFALSWYSPKELGKEDASQLRTSRGLIPKEGRTIAVDPKVISYGSTVYIEGYGYFIAEDCGGAIKGSKIDIFTNSYSHAISQGRKVANVWIIGKKK